MSYADRIQDRLNRVKEITKIKKKLKKLKSKRKMSAAAFCREYDFDNTHLSHAINGKRGMRQDTIDRINKALDNEFNKDKKGSVDK